MAITLHTELVKQGPFAILSWRKDNPKLRLDLSGADLRYSNLGGCDLSGSDLRDADLSQANLFGANLAEAQLEGASLYTSVATCANLFRASLDGADLRLVQFNDGNGSSANLREASLRNARFTSQGDGDVWNGFLELAGVEGLETVKFSDSSFLPDYLESVFAYAADPDSPENRRYPNFFRRLVERIHALRPVLRETTISEEVKEVTQMMTRQLLGHLKSNYHAIHSLRPRQFEELIAELLSNFGWGVTLSKATRDGGFDIFAISKDAPGVSTSWLVECKRYPSNRMVGLEVVRSLYGVKHEVGAANILLATTSSFSKAVHEFKTSRYDLTLIDSKMLEKWIEDYSERAPILSDQEEQLIVEE